MTKYFCDKCKKEVDKFGASTSVNRRTETHLLQKDFDILCEDEHYRSFKPNFNLSITVINADAGATFVICKECITIEVIKLIGDWVKAVNMEAAGIKI